MIDERTVQRVKEAASIVDVMEEDLDLMKDGVNFTCLCPFHNDRHIGSFKISPKRNTYTCFSCGAHGGPVDYLMNRRQMKFADAIRYLGKKYGIHVEGSEKMVVKPAMPRKPIPALPTLTLPITMVQKKAGTDNTLCHWLRSLAWDDEQRKRVDTMLKNYAVGTSKEGHTIWWQIDEEGKVRTGKLMRYKPDGHRDRDSKGNFGWVHSRLMRAKWYDPDKFDMRQTLFGMHLLDFCPNATVNIVESEKSALICAIAYGSMEANIWMATGGLTNLSREKLMPIIKRGRRIVLYPDRDGIEEWRERAQAIGYRLLDINTMYILGNWKEEDGPKGDIADIIVRLMKPPPPKPSPELERMMADNPHIRTLVNKLNLESIG